MKYPTMVPTTPPSRPMPRLHQEDAPYVAYSLSYCLEHADLAAAFVYRGEHCIGDPERGDRERDHSDGPT